MMNGVASDLLALAHALRAGQVTPAGTVDRLLILAHRAHVSAAQAGILPARDEIPAPPTPGDEGGEQ
jgi:hypothetical protein